MHPFTFGYGFFGFNDPSWFLIALFETEVLNWMFRLALKKTGISEHGICAIYLCTALMAVFFARTHEHTAITVVLTKVLYMLFWFNMGTYYKVFLEKKDTVPNGLYFTFVLLIEFVVVGICGENGNSAYIHIAQFSNNGILTILSCAAGIMFFLRISRILVASIGDSLLVKEISMHTFSIMMRIKG